MSNFARINKNSIISTSTNDNTSSVNKLNRGMDENELKGIQKRLASKMGIKNKDGFGHSHREVSLP